MKLSQISIHAWLQEHQIKNEAGNLLDFRDHLFLFDIYADNSPKLVCYKAAQIGFSTMAILKSLWLAKMKGLDIIYTMPSSSDMKDFVGGKVNRIITQNPVLLDYVKDKDSIEQKQVGDNIIYYRGTWTEKAAIAVSSDLNIHDEEDRSKQEVIQQYASRLQHSAKKWEWHFSNPSVEGNGVSRYWARSDQKHWFITCKGCEQDQYLSWPDNINMERRVFICKHCHKELTREERRVGRWVKRFRDREYSGYWISLLMAPWITAEEIISYYETKSAEYFSNFVLGLPYVGEGNQVTPDIIYRNCTTETNSQERVVIGCDSGLKKHYVLGNKDGIFYAGIAKDWSEIDSLLLKYSRSIAVIDALPDLSEPRKLREKYPGRVFLCHYARDRKTFQLIRWGKREELGNVTVDRNRMMQIVIDDFAAKRIPLQGTQDDWSEFASHWDTLYKVIEVDALGVPQSVWATSNGMDHFCFISGTKVTTGKGEKNIEDIKVGDEVLTRFGYSVVYDAGLKRKKQDVVTAYFSNGTSFTATPDHPIIHSVSKDRLDSITRHAILYSCQNQKVLYTEGLLTDVTRNLQDEKQEFTLPPMERLGGKDIKGFTSRYGLMLMEKSLRGVSFIIKTKIRLITSFLTWCARKEVTTKVTTRIVDLRFLFTGNETENTLPQFNLSPMSGDVLKQEKIGIAHTLIKHSFWILPKYLSVLSATIKALHEAITAVNSVAPDVHLVGLHENIVKKDVINLSVEDTHEYFANGILVSNCHAALYWRVGMDRFKNDGGKIFTGEPEYAMGSFIRPDNTIDANPLHKDPNRPRFIFPEVG